MPPHCDSLDGPVVKAAAAALEARNVELVLPYVPEEGEREVKEAFAQTLAVEPLAPAAKKLADEWFFENVVRIHRAGEGACLRNPGKPTIVRVSTRSTGQPSLGWHAAKDGRRVAGADDAGRWGLAGMA